MAGSEAEIVCRIHPNQTPQPGICPSCLRDRLSRIAANSKINNTFSPSSPNSFPTSPVYYYYFSSSGGSPPSDRRHQRVASDVMESIYMAISGTQQGLKKSRSMAYVPTNGERDNRTKKKKKKGGFWNKLLIRYSLKKV